MNLSHMVQFSIPHLRFQPPHESSITGYGVFREGFASFFSVYRQEKGRHRRNSWKCFFFAVSGRNARGEIRSITLMGMSLTHVAYVEGCLVFLKLLADVSIPLFTCLKKNTGQK